MDYQRLSQISLEKHGFSATFWGVRSLTLYVKEITKYKIDVVMATAVPALPPDSGLGYQIYEAVLQVLTSTVQPTVLQKKA